MKTHSTICTNTHNLPLKQNPEISFFSPKKCTVCAVHKTPSKTSLVLTRAESLGTAETFYLSVVGNVSHRQALCRICEHLLDSQGRAGASWVCPEWCARLSVNFHMCLPFLISTELRESNQCKLEESTLLETGWKAFEALGK